MGSKKAKYNLRKDDLVMVVSGQYKPRGERRSEGRILAVDREKGRVLVEGVNYRKHHTKVTQGQQGPEGGIEEREGWLHISNVALVDPVTKKPVRVGVKEKDGRRVRYTKGRNSSGTVLE